MFIFPLFLSGCSQRTAKATPQQLSQKSEQSSDKAPDQLTGMEENIEKIIQTLHGPSGDTKADSAKTPQQSGMSSQDKQGGQGKGKEQGQGQQKQGQQAPGQQTPGQQTSQQDPWETVSAAINTLHYQWDSYMPSAVKAGANKKLMENFSNALNSLTTTIIGKNRTNTLMAASYLYAYIPDFYSLYKTETSSDIKRVRYYTRNALLNAITANWTQADHDLNNLKSLWSLYRTTLDKDKQDISNKIDLSIIELEKVIKERNQPLTDIKGRVMISNIDSMEKSSKKSSGQQSSGGGSQSGSGQAGSSQSGGS